MIDQAILAGQPFAKIAKQFGLSGAAIGRHKHGHLVSQVAKAVAQKQANESAHNSHLVAYADGLRLKAMDCLDKAENAGNLAMALKAIREARETIKLLAELTGELASGNTTNVAVFQLPEWTSLTKKIIEALADEPSAREKIIRVLGGEPLSLPVPEDLTIIDAIVSESVMVVDE